MSELFLHKDNFSGGQVGRAHWGRRGLERVAAGCEVLENFFPLASGGLVARAGGQFMGYGSNGTGGGKPGRLVDFIFSESTFFVLEVTPGALRVWSNGALVPLEAAVVAPWGWGELWEVQTFQVKDLMIMTHRNHPPQVLRRVRDTLWTLASAWADLSAGAVSVVPGEAGKCLLEEWAWPEIPAFAAASDDIAPWLRLDIPGSDPNPWQEQPGRPPHGVAVGVSTVPAATAAKGIRRLTFVFKASAGGNHTFYFQGGLKGWGRVGPLVVLPAGVETSVVLSLLPGQEVIVWLMSWAWSGAANSNNLWVKVAYTGFAKGAVPAANLRRWDTVTVGALRDLGVSYPPMLDENVSETTLAVSHTAGTGRVVVASAPVFQSGHVGAYFEIVHRREFASVDYTGTAAAAPGSAFAGSSAELRVLGSWDFFSYGLWSGRVFIEKRPVGTATWFVERSWDVKLDGNRTAGGTELQEVEMRVRVENGMGITNSGNILPRFEITAGDARRAGLMRVTAVTSSTAAVVDVVRDLASVQPTPFWSEGAFSGIRGYPAAVGSVEQRLYFAGVKSMPWRLFGSWLGDIFNFRRGTNADCSFSLEMASGASESVVGLAGLSEELVILCEAGEWTLGRNDNREGLGISGANFLLRQRSSFGASRVQPVPLAEGLAYVSGRRIRRIKTDGGAWENMDLTALNQDVGDASVVELAVARLPGQMLFALDGTGAVWCLNFDVGAGVFAWAWWNFPSLVKSLATVPGGLWLSCEGLRPHLESIPPGPGGKPGLLRVPLAFADAGCWDDPVADFDTSDWHGLDWWENVSSKLTPLVGGGYSVAGTGVDEVFFWFGARPGVSGEYTWSHGPGTISGGAGEIHGTTEHPLPTGNGRAIAGLKIACRMRPVLPEMAGRPGSLRGHKWRIGRARAEFALAGDVVGTWGTTGRLQADHWTQTANGHAWQSDGLPALWAYTGAEGRFWLSEVGFAVDVAEDRA